jgi:hypothetical protein
MSATSRKASVCRRRAPRGEAMRPHRHRLEFCTFRSKPCSRRRARPRWREPESSTRAPSVRVATLPTAGFRRSRTPSCLRADRTRRRPVFREGGSAVARFLPAASAQSRRGRLGTTRRKAVAIDRQFLPALGEFQYAVPIDTAAVTTLSPKEVASESAASAAVL